MRTFWPLLACAAARLADGRPDLQGVWDHVNDELNYVFTVDDPAHYTRPGRARRT